MAMIEGRTSAELREKCMRDYFAPVAAAIFARDPSAQSVGYLVGQYWADEAEDAVHAEVVPFTQRDPRWPDDARPDDEEHPFERLEALFADVGSFYEFTRDLPGLDENASAITAFAAFCKEECHQEMSLAESHLLYAVARRDGAGVAIEVVGEMLRPEWEDRFDVGFDAPDQADELPPRGAWPGQTARAADTATPPPRRSGLLGFLRRWFGG